MPVLQAIRQKHRLPRKEDDPFAEENDSRQPSLIEWAVNVGSFLACAWSSKAREGVLLSAEETELCERRAVAQ